MPHEKTQFATCYADTLPTDFSPSSISMFILFKVLKSYVVSEYCANLTLG